MAELTQKERLQPALLDRLTDDDPQNKQESREKRVLTMRRLRASVLRDLSWLLNTTNLESSEDIEQAPEVMHSVLNYGMPCIAGMAAAATDVRTLQRQLKQVILDFEPRILSDSLNVKVTVSEEEMSNNALVFEIEGDLWGQPLPQHLFLKTVIDLNSSHVVIQDMNG